MIIQKKIVKQNDANWAITTYECDVCHWGSIFTIPSHKCQDSDIMHQVVEVIA